MNQIENLLRQTMGLHAATIGSTLIEHNVRMRMRCHGLADADDYVKMLRQYPAEWKALIESMVVTETWFFRDRPAFAAMARLVVEEWLPKNPEGMLRLLSVPCSSGEEPYSMAMALLDAGLPAARFRIDAVDISMRAILVAERAVYGRNSFRGPDLAFRDCHFRPSHGNFALSPNVRRQARFRQGNLLDPNCLTERALYDVIFCRNLLIYFDRPTQDQTLAKLRSLLMPNGLLFMGPAELSLALDSGFAPVNSPLSFACRNTNAMSKSSASRNGSAIAQPSAKPIRHSSHLVVPPTQIPHPGRRNGEKMPGHKLLSSGTLRHARKLVGEGRLSEAAELCDRHLREHGASAEAFFVLGWVRDATGADRQAGEYYRKALYLEPGHGEALHRWAQLSERRGDLKHAKILRARAQRRTKKKVKGTGL